MLLVSFRTPGLVAVFEPKKRTVAWAAKGPWQGQHDAQFLDNGHLLLFDNIGSERGSRVLEYEPATQAISWSYSSDDFGRTFVPCWGSAQRLRNGNTLIVNPERSVFETTESKKVVWQFGQAAPHLPNDATPSPEKKVFTGARRFSPGELTFLMK